MLLWQLLHLTNTVHFVQVSNGTQWKKWWPPPEAD